MTPRVLFFVLLGALLAGCAGPAASRSSERDAAAPSGQQARVKAIKVAVSVSPKPFGLAGDTTPTGGWAGIIELHSEGLVTSDASSRQPVGRLAARVPTVDDGTIALLPDGRMRVAFALRPNVTWHDGTPFTAQDLVFSAQLGGPNGMPSAINVTSRLFDSAEALDAGTFIVYYKAP